MLALAAKRTLAAGRAGSALTLLSKEVGAGAGGASGARSGLFGHLRDGGTVAAATRGTLSPSTSHALHIAATAARAAPAAGLRSPAAAAAQRAVDGARAEIFSLRRAFCAETPKKSGWENFQPKGGKPAKPGKSGEGEGAKSNTEGSGGGKGGAGGSGKGSGGKNDGGPATIGELFTQMVNNPQFNQVLALVSLASLVALFYGSATDAREISFQEFKTSLLEQGLVDRVEVSNKTQAKVYVHATPAAAGSQRPGFNAAAGPGGSQSSLKYYFNIGSLDSFERKMEDAQELLGIDPHLYVPVTYLDEVNLTSALVSLAPTLLLMGGLFFISRRMSGMQGMGGGGGGGMMNVGKATVSTLDKNAKHKIMFKDVAGCDEAKMEIMEFVDFLKRPKKYEDLGAKIPRGALLVGPPGTGKTLLAKATAGEAGVPFLSISGSDFMEMFVGVGPSRVRDLFAQVHRPKPSTLNPQFSILNPQP